MEVEFAYRTVTLACLPLDVLESVCQRLSLKDRVCLTSCCHALWARRDLRASAGLWGNLAFTVQQLAPPHKRASLAAWLARRTDAARRVRLSCGGAGAGAVSLLGCLEGAPLEAMVLSSHLPLDDTEAALRPLRRLPTLTRLELRGGLVTKLPSHVTCLPGLASLDVSRNTCLGGQPDAALRPLASLAATLTRLDLSACGVQRLPACAAALTTLASLDLNTSAFGDDEAALAPLASMRALTALNLRWCSLRRLPASLAALSRLRVLDASRNMGLGAGGGGGGERLLPLASLSALTHLDLSYCNLCALPPLGTLGQLSALLLSGNLQLGEAPEECWAALRGACALTRLDLTRCQVPQRWFDLLVAMSTSGVCVSF